MLAAPKLMNLRSLTIAVVTGLSLRYRARDGSGGDGDSDGGGVMYFELTTTGNGDEDGGYRAVAFGDVHVNMVSLVVRAADAALGHLGGSKGCVETGWGEALSHRR